MKKIDENIEYWLKTAEHDLETCKAMFDSGHYDWSLYIGHLVLEKVIKANYISVLKVMPPKTHDLIYLISKLSLNIEDDIYETLEKANNYHLEARYPDEKLSFYKLCTKEFTEPRLDKILRAYEWLKSQLK